MVWTGLLLIWALHIWIYLKAAQWKPGKEEIGAMADIDVYTAEQKVSAPVYSSPGDEGVLQYDTNGYKALNFIYEPTVRCIPEWFIDQWVVNLTISPAEQLIINELQKYRIYWVREISFVDMPRTEKGANYRFDFLLPNHQIVIEYHGKFWHNDEEKISGDKLKEQFCIQHDIEYLVYSGKQYYSIEKEISKLMDRLNVVKY